MKEKPTSLSIHQHLIESGFVFPGSQIYGGLANAWDYGPLGVSLINQLKKIWWNFFVIRQPNVYGLDSKILMNPQVWKVSGHTENFQDWYVENKLNQKRYRVDHLLAQIDPSQNWQNQTHAQIEKFLREKVTKWEGQSVIWGEIRRFNLMFETDQGVVNDEKNRIFLRPELAQGILINYKNVLRSMRAELPFGIAQIGRSFRNEITPRNFIFRTREFEQMELEWFCEPGQADQFFLKYQTFIKEFLNLLGLDRERWRWREHEKHELAHYAQKTVDVEFNFGFGWGEIIGLANRGDYDLKKHSQASQEDFSYSLPGQSDKIYPFVIEPSFGVDRLALALLENAYSREKLADQSERIVLKLSKDLAPYQIAVLPLVKKIHGPVAEAVYHELLSQGYRCTYDQSGSIGKRYRRQDAIGTPICLTVIDQTKRQGEVTIRDRDTMKQVTIMYKNIKNHV